MNADNALSVKKINAGYGKATVIRDISFDLPKGRICAVIGPNGCGKTTLIRSVAGLLRHTGECFLADGRDVSRLTYAERAGRIGYMSSGAAVPEGVTCLETVLTAFSAQLGLIGRATDEQKDKALEVLDRLTVAGIAVKEMSAVSGGQRQMVLLARAMVNDPELMLLDEPDAALDFGRRRIMADNIRAQTDKGCTVLIASHDVNSMLKYADRLLLMKDGGIISDIAPRTDTMDDILAGLKALYGSVDLIVHGADYVMVGEDA